MLLLILTMVGRSLQYAADHLSRPGHPSASACLSTVHQLEWFDNTFSFVHNASLGAACHHHSYDYHEMKAVLGDKCILLIGDSLSRRLTATIVVMLLHPFDHQYDDYQYMNRGGHGHEEFERDAIKLNATSLPMRCLHFQWAPTIANVTTWLQNSANAASLQQYSHVFVSNGAHETNASFPIADSNYLKVMAIACAADATFTFRVAPGNDQAPQILYPWNDLLRKRFNGSHSLSCAAHSEFARNKSLYLLDHAASLEARAHKPYRIAGDTSVHFGAIARVAEAQVLFNFLHVLDSIHGPVVPRPVGTGIPDGTLIKGSGRECFLVKNGRKYSFPNLASFVSRGFDFSEVRVVSDAALAAIPIGGTVEDMG